MLSIILVQLVLGADVCDRFANDANDYLNDECNLAGICIKYPNADAVCACCDSSRTDWRACGGLVPGEWVGDTCNEARNYYAMFWGYIVDSADASCADDGSPSTPDFVDEVAASVVDMYDGVILAEACETCSVASPCNDFDPPITEGIYVNFATDLNTYYDKECGDDKIPDSRSKCDANFDNGLSAKLAFYDVIDDDNEFAAHIASLNTIVGSDMVHAAYSEFRFEDYLSTFTTRFPSPSPSLAPISEDPTVFPTINPTSTIVPETIDDCARFVNDVADLAFVDAGSSCRANINESWTGGRTCDSPYIICLPEENTPAIDIMGNPYKNDTHRYSVQECLRECSYDQRCLGVEFVADSGSKLGDCNLIDDIPVAVENPQFFVYSEAYSVLDNITTGGNALCWEKKDYCNPYFEAEDLSDDMLSCYCPNNRKGFYTKKVKRTVNNTRYCYDDAIVDQRIKKAQANRMFHLCENWCLFETSNPDQENWYWDPWKQCWRETYSANGKHTGYCDRVIRNPDSIELKFVNHRVNHFCGATKQPTSAPVADSNTTWVLAEVFESCDDACSRNGGVCAAEQTTRRFSSEDSMNSAFIDAGATCDSLIMNRTKFEGWALPGMLNGKCVNRQIPLAHLTDLDSDCNRKIGGQWQRLCACLL